MSILLGALRLAEVVRDDTNAKRNRYRLKHLRPPYPLKLLRPRASRVGTSS